MQNNELTGFLAAVMENKQSLEEQLIMNFRKKLFDKKEAIQEAEQAAGALTPDENEYPLGIAIRIEHTEEGPKILGRFMYREPNNIDLMSERETLFLLSAGIEGVISMMNLTEAQVEDYLNYLKGLLEPKFKNGCIIYFHEEKRTFNITNNGLEWEVIKLVDFVNIEEVIRGVIGQGDEKQ